MKNDEVVIGSTYGLVSPQALRLRARAQGAEACQVLSDTLSFAVAGRG